MKSPLVFALGLGILTGSVSAQDKPDFTNHNQKINYALGLDIISTFKQQEFDIDINAVLAGMEDSLAGKAMLTTDQKKAAFIELQVLLQDKEKARWKVAAVNNLKDGQDFLAMNALKEGVKIKKVTAPDGSKAELQYKILKSGSGPSPKLTDIVEVHYEGTRIDGSIFDSSLKRGIPATFGLTDVIPGWREALPMMKVGDKWQLFIPAKLAYGEYGLPQLGPNSTLIFQVELLSFYTPKPTVSSTNAPPAATK